MTLTSSHQSLISTIASWCEQQSDPEKFVIMIDEHSEGFNYLPPRIGNYRPDLVWMYSSGKYHFIGEAKTRNDLNNAHTRNQISAYLSVLEDQGSGKLIIAVPWGLEGTARSLVASLERKLECKTRRWLVLSNAPNR